MVKKVKELEKDVEVKDVNEDEVYEPEVIYKSKLLNQEFDDLESLKAAEKEYRAELAKKEEAKLARKEDADLVQAAWVERNKANANYNDAYAKASQARTEAIKKINEEFYNAIKEAKANYEEAAEKYSKVLADFQAKHPEGYHLTLKDGDNQLVLSKRSNADLFKSMSDQMEETLNFFKKFWF